MTSGVGLDPLLVGFLVSVGGDLSGIWFNDNLNLGSASLDGLGPEFTGSIGDWVNKINHLGNRKWTDPETGTSYYINDNGQITGYYPVTGIAPSPGKGSKFALQLSKQLAKDGPKSIIKSYISTQKRLLEHQAKLQVFNIQAL